MEENAAENINTGERRELESWGQYSALCAELEADKRAALDRVLDALALLCRQEKKGTDTITFILAEMVLSENLKSWLKRQAEQEAGSPAPDGRALQDRLRALLTKQ